MYLDQYYDKNSYPNAGEKAQLASELGCTVAKIDGWFRNRRWSDKKKAELASKG